MDLTSGYPYWLIKNGLPRTYPKLEEAVKTDVVVIGGGISGALTAYYLINSGISCVVVDARTIGLGSTCASTSLLQYELDKPLSALTKQIGPAPAIRAYTLCYDAIDTLEQIAKKIKFNEFKRSGSLFFAKNKKDIRLIENEFSAREKAGFEVRLMGTEEIKKEYGFSPPGGIFSSQAATTNAYMLTHFLLQSGTGKGLRVYNRTVINGISYTKRGVNLTTENGYSIRAKKIVNAAGYEVTEFIAKKIVKLDSTYAIASEPIQRQKIQWKNDILWNTDDPYLYMRLTDDNRIIAGGRDEPYYNPAARDKLIRKKTRQLK